MVELWMDFLSFWYFPYFLKWVFSAFITIKRNKSFKILPILNLMKNHWSLLRFVFWPQTYHDYSVTHGKKDDLIMRTMSHSFIRFVLFIPPFHDPKKGFSPAFKKPVVGQTRLNGVKSGNNFIFLISLCFKPA